MAIASQNAAFSQLRVWNASSIESPKKSKNFWLRWSIDKQSYMLVQRVSASMPPVMAEYKFDDKKVDQMLKCLVLGKRIKPRAVRRRRFWLF